MRLLRAPIRTWLSRMSIRKRLIVFLLLGLLPILISSAYFFYQVYQARRQQVLLGHMATAQATAGTVGEFIEGIVQAQEVMATVIGDRGLTTPEELTEFLQQVQEDVPVIGTIAFAAPSGRVIAAAPRNLVGTDIGESSYFQEVLAGRDWTVSDLLPDSPAGRQGFAVAQRVTRNGTLAGVLFSTVPPATLRQFVAVTASPDVGYGILDSEGRIIVTTILPEDLVPAYRDRSRIPSVNEALDGRPAFAEPFRDPADGVQRMGASVPVPEIGWVVNVLEPVSSAMAPVRRAAVAELASELAAIILLVLLAWLIGTSISEPIISLAGKSEAVAQGDFSQRMETRDRAEIGMLASSFNNMTAELERAREEGRKAREQAVFLADIGELLVSTLDTDTILETVARRTVDCIGDIVVIFTLEARDLLMPVAIHAYDEELGNKARRLIADRPIHVGSGVVGTAVESDHTFFAENVPQLEDPNLRYYLERAGVISSIAVPMRVHGQTVGALSVSSVHEPLKQEQVPLVEEIARRLGLALENIHLYGEALDRESFQKSLAELAASVSSSLDPGVVLTEICSRTMEVLKADGVYIWVMDDDKTVLTGTCACGFNADAFIGLTLPMSDRSAGAVQAVVKKRGFYLHEMPAWKDVAPMLTAMFHAQASMFVPLLSAGEVLGVVVVTDTQDPDRFDDQSLARATIVTGYAAAALSNASVYQRERRIAETLQRGLLPAVPSTVRNFELANYYTPAWREAAIGGDFYDFIELRNDAFGLVIGDVSGKGLQAAVVTAMAKYVLRAYTAEDPEPVTVLEKTNNAIAKYTEPELFITLVYGLLDARTRRFRYGSAGHEPVLIYRAGEKSVTYEDPTGAAAGLILNGEYLTHEVLFAPGDLIMLYTDGLTDARSPDGQFLGQEGLAKLVTGIADQPASAFLDALLERIRDYTGGKFSDDVAVLVIRAIPI